MRILNLEQGLFFEMGDGKNWRVVHPDMGATQITLRKIQKGENREQNNKGDK
jgi:hypothetical protein